MAEALLRESRLSLPISFKTEGDLAGLFLTSYCRQGSQRAPGATRRPWPLSKFAQTRFGNFATRDFVWPILMEKRLSGAAQPPRGEALYRKLVGPNHTAITITSDCKRGFIFAGKFRKVWQPQSSTGTSPELQSQNITLPCVDRSGLILTLGAAMKLKGLREAVKFVKRISLENIS